MMKKILILTDFSSVASHALDVSLQLATLHEAQLIVFHVLADETIVDFGLGSESDVRHKDKTHTTYNNIDKYYKKIKDANVNARMVLGAGALISALQAVLDEEDIDMIVMGSTGKGNSSGPWGTNTQRVVKKVDVPVLVIKTAMPTSTFKNIVFASDLDIEDQIALRKSLALLKPPMDATIHLVSINTSSYFSQPGALMTSLLEDFQQLVKPYNANSTFYKSYSVSSGIRQFVEETTPDLLIMSTRKGRPIKDVFIPDASISAIGEIECPILIVE